MISNNKKCLFVCLIVLLCVLVIPALGTTAVELRLAKVNLVIERIEAEAAKQNPKEFRKWKAFISEYKAKKNLQEKAKVCKRNLPSIYKTTNGVCKRTFYSLGKETYISANEKNSRILYLKALKWFNKALQLSDYQLKTGYEEAVQYFVFEKNAVPFSGSNDDVIDAYATFVSASSLNSIGSSDAHNKFDAAIYLFKAILKNPPKAFPHEIQPSVIAKIGFCYWYLNKPTVAFSYFLTSAKMGNENGQVSVSLCYMYGNGVLQNYKEAYAWGSVARTRDKVLSQEYIDGIERKLLLDDPSGAQLKEAKELAQYYFSKYK